MYKVRSCESVSHLILHACFVDISLNVESFRLQSGSSASAQFVKIFSSYRNDNKKTNKTSYKATNKRICEMLTHLPLTIIVTRNQTTRPFLILNENSNRSATQSDKRWEKSKENKQKKKKNNRNFFFNGSIVF